MVSPHQGTILITSEIVWVSSASSGDGGGSDK